MRAALWRSVRERGEALCPQEAAPDGEVGGRGMTKVMTTTGGAHQTANMDGSVLVVVAHPDDETLGAGATMHRLAQGGVPVHVCVLSADVQARHLRPDDDSLREDTLRALDRLGVTSVAFGAFPNIKMNTVPHLDLVQFIEATMVQCGASSILTHHPSDLNDDHRQVSKACQAAARLPQRQSGRPPLRGLYFMEILSATDWAFGPDGFLPTLFEEVGDDDIGTKLAALSEYRDVMRPHPHPRSVESIRALATLRGSQCGVSYAEAFTCASELRRGVEGWR